MMDANHPTILVNTDGASEGKPNISRGQVGFVAGTGDDFRNETAALLSRRLTAATLVVVVVLAAAFVGNLLGGVATLRWVRTGILLALGGCLVVLTRRTPLSLHRLRILEMVVFGLVSLQVGLMQVFRMADFAAREDAVSVAAARQQYLGAWCVLIFVYGIFMPNTWKRAALVLVPIALLPYALTFGQTWFDPNMAVLLAADHAATSVPLPLVTAIGSAYAAHTLYAARREAFQARQFGQYRLLERLGGGGMGEVYRAEHVLLKRPCAIKLIRAADETDVAAIARFEKEVTATARLTHWNTIEIFDFGRTDDGTFYYVMELLPGMSLEDLVEKHGPMPPERVVHLLRQVCAALQEAHAMGLIHRDIKPANIFAARRGGIHDVAKLLDFGLVKERSDSPDQGPALGSFSGTPLFMSPEQASAYEQVDARADLYSLGAVAYYLLTGEPPFTGRNLGELLAAHRRQEAAPVSSKNDAVPTDLEAILLRCLAKKPGDRHPDARSMMAALASCSLADRWGPEEAERWWQNLEMEAAEKPTAPVVPIDVTVDYRIEPFTPGSPS